MGSSKDMQVLWYLVGEIGVAMLGLSRDTASMVKLPNSETLWTVQEYLSTSWSPDREFIDGRIEERNLGEKEHSIIQRYLTVLFAIRRDEWRVEVFPELRTQIGATNFHVPDVCVVGTEKVSIAS